VAVNRSIRGEKAAEKFFNDVKGAVEKLTKLIDSLPSGHSFQVYIRNIISEAIHNAIRGEKAAERYFEKLLSEANE